MFKIVKQKPNSHGGEESVCIWSYLGLVTGLVITFLHKENFVQTDFAKETIKSHTCQDVPSTKLPKAI
jgi:hypothetical protein